MPRFGASIAGFGGASGSRHARHAHDIHRASPSLLSGGDPYRVISRCTSTTCPLRSVIVVRVWVSCGAGK